MGILDRFRGVRQEATQRIFGTTVKKNTPPTYVNDFILGQYWSHNDPKCQAKMIQMNPYAWAVTTGLAYSVFEDGIRFVSVDDPEKEIMQDTLKELKRMEFLKWAALALGGERAHGHVWFYVGEEELTTDTTIGSPRVAELDVFTPEYAKVSKWHDNGKPKELLLKVLVGSSSVFEEIPIPVEDCILVRTRPYDRSHRGLPVTGPIWNALVSTALIDHAITTYSMKWGLGGLVMKTKGSISTEDKAAAQTMMEDFSVSTVGVIPGRAVESLEYVGASGTAVDFAAYQDIFLDEIAAGTKIPKSIIIGEAEGAITGAEVGPGQLAQLRQGEQRRFEPVIRELVRRMGVTEDYEIDWPVKMAIDRKQEAEIRFLEAQAAGAEASAEMVKSGRGPNDIQVSLKDEDKKQNPAGVQAK